MSEITNNISKMLALTTTDMPVYVVGDAPLAEKIRSGWPTRNVSIVPMGVKDVDCRGLVIIDSDTFFVKF